MTPPHERNLPAPRNHGLVPRLRSIAFDTLLFVANRFVARVPSHALRQWFYRSALKCRIGTQSAILMDAWFDARGNFTLGRNSVINQRCRLDNRGPITIGDNVSISAEVVLLTADHDLQSPDFAGRERAIHIEDFVFVGTRAMIMPGVTIGTGAAVAAGAIVTRDVAAYDIVAGIPARKIGERSRDLTYELSYRRLLF